jgi:hypothetical protein
LIFWMRNGEIIALRTFEVKAVRVKPTQRRIVLAKVL